MLFLSADTAFGQLLKLPELVKHYHSHHGHHGAKKHSKSLLSFLEQHYLKLHSNTGAGGHENLPFKNVGANAIGITMTLPPNSPVTLVTLQTFDKANQPVYRQQPFTSIEQNNIWQPPRFS